MVKNSKYVILATIFALAFAYRFFLTTMNTYPPGADIGLHQSVIASITSNKPSFFWNYYQMGGGVSATNPGYHIFTAFVINVTGLPDYLAQALVASFFSAFLVLCAFLLVRQAWNELAGFLAAILVTFSAGDIIMLSWAGYPNIVALALIPTVFYVFLQSSKSPSKSYAAAASILVGAIFITHVFSGLMFTGITLLTVLVCGLFAEKADFNTVKAVYWLMPIGIGLLLVSPYLVRVIPIYFGPQGTIVGASTETIQAVLETRLAPVEIIGLSLIPVFLFFVFSKYKNAKGLSVSSVLFALWILIPALGTQAYLFGFYLDYERFLYFLALPSFTCLGIVIASLPNTILRAAQTLNNFTKRKILVVPSQFRKKAWAGFLVSALTVLVLLSPLFSLPSAGVTEANYFQVMNPPLYQAIQWVKDDTPVGSVCVADAQFGWWLSGFAQRPTLSAVDSQYLILQHEIGAATVAADLLTADYIVNNGIIQIQQRGAYSIDNTHDILAVLNTTYVHPSVFMLNDTQTSLLFRQNGLARQTNLVTFNQTSTVVKNNLDNASFVITRENQFLKITEQITIFKGVRFAQVSFLLQSSNPQINFDWLQLPFQARGFVDQVGDSVGIVDDILHEETQLVFPPGQLGAEINLRQNPTSYEMIYNLHGATTSEVSFFVGLCQFSSPENSNDMKFYTNLILSNSHSYLDQTSDQPVNSFDYQTAIQQWNISYIAIRDASSLARFSSDPTFTTVFKNSQITIFKVD